VQNSLARNADELRKIGDALSVLMPKRWAES
jgi:hypothetical protein